VQLDVGERNVLAKLVSLPLVRLGVDGALIDECLIEPIRK